MANPFSQAKNLYKMQKEARAMQTKMKQVQVNGFSKNEQVEVVMNGANELENVLIDDALLSVEKKELLEKYILEAYKDAAKKLQKELMKDMDLDKMKSMLGM